MFFVKVFLATLLSCLIATAAYADTKREQLLNAAYQFHQWANMVYGVERKNPLPPKEIKAKLNELFVSDVTHYLNGKIVAYGVDELTKRFEGLDQNYATVNVVLPYKDVVVDEPNQKVAVRYESEFTLKNGTKKRLYCMAVFRIRDGKLSEFNEVSSNGADNL